MIKATNTQAKYQCVLDNGSEQNLLVDLPSSKGGTGNGVTPLELLEGALASCMNISLRLQAEKEGIELESVQTTVSMQRDENGKTTFSYDCKFDETIDPQTAEKIKAVLQRCAVRSILTNPIEVKEASVSN